MFSFPWRRQKTKQPSSRETSSTEQALYQEEDKAIKELLGTKSTAHDGGFNDQFLGTKREPAFSLKFK